MGKGVVWLRVRAEGKWEDRTWAGAFSREGSLGGLKSHVQGSREPCGVGQPAPCLCSGLPAYSSQVPREVPLVVLTTQKSGDRCLRKVFLDRTWLMVTKLTVYSVFLLRKQKPLQINSITRAV